MLCRALVTAIAISCTFSREVIGQGTPPNVHKKDLICVLWLSGLQKEDLDVNILRKLRRHDVNIDDMDNETLHRDCLQLQLFNQNKSTKETSTRDTVKNQTKAVVTKNKGRSNIKQIVTSDLNVLLANLINNDNIKTSNATKTFLDIEARTLKTFKENTSTKNSQTSYVDEDDTLTSPFDTTGSPKNVVKRNRKQNLEEVINFWKMFKTTQLPLDLFELTTQKQNILSTTVEDEKQTVINVDNENKQARPEYINKLLADYYNNKFPDTLQATTTPPIDIKKLSQQIETLLEIVSQSEKYNRSKFQENEESKIKLGKEMLPWKYQFTNGIPLKSALQLERLRQYNTYQPTPEDNYFTRNADLSYDSSKKKSFQFDYRYVTQDPVNNYRQKYEIPSNKLSTNYEYLLNNEGVTKSLKENLNKTDDVKVLSKDVMKEIADNIKALVLKDLAQVITTKSTTPLSTTIKTTTTEITKTTAQHSINSTVLTTTATRNHKTQLNKTQDPTQVMEKFINLFEQFKTMKDKTIVTGQMKVNILEKRTLRPDYKNPLSINNRAPILVVNSRVKASLGNQPMLYSQLGIQNIPVKKVKFINLPITSASVLEVQPIHSQKKGVPIMMQTNSGEIPPLGIPISKPFKLIHQNIVVTTVRPIDLYKKQSDTLMGAFGAYNRDTNFKNPSKISKDVLQKHSVVVNQSDQLKSDRLLELKSYREIPKQQEQRPYQNERLKNERVSNHQTRLEDETARLSEQRSYRNARFRNREDSRRPPRFEDEQLKIMQQRLYKTQRNKNLEDSYRSSRFEDERILQDQNPSYKSATIKKQDEDNYPSLYNDEKLKLLQQKSYKSSSIGNQQDYPSYLSPRIEYETAKSYKNSGMTNQEDSLFLSRYNNENLKSRDQTRTKTIRIVNYDDGSRPRAFDDEKLKLLEQSSYNRNQEINDQPLYLDEESTKPMEQRLYKSERIKNNKESSHQSYFDDERSKLVEPKMYQSARIQNDEDVRPTRLKDIQEYEKLNRDKMDKIKAYEGETKFPGDKISYGSFRNHDREKFHEKLERVDDWRDEQDNRKDKKQLTFSARQQQPLNDVKKISTYDDTHFNEFLKTQQKVNDMLEKILATKTGRTGPHSIESI